MCEDLQSSPLSKLHVFLAIWMNLEGIKLSEISQIKRDKYCPILFMYKNWKLQMYGEIVK